MLIGFLIIIFEVKGRVIILSINGESEARKFLIYLLLNYKEPIMAYRGAGAGGEQGLLILMGVSQEVMLVSINDEPGECRDSDYYFLADFNKLSCGKGMPDKDILINSPVMFILSDYELFIDASSTIERAESRGIGAGKSN